MPIHPSSPSINIFLVWLCCSRLLHSTPPHAQYSILPYNASLPFPRMCSKLPITHPIRIRAIQYWRLQYRSLIHTKASPPIFFLFKLTNWQWFSQPGWQPPVQPGPTTKASWCALPKEALLRILDAIGPKWNMSDLTGINAFLANMWWEYFSFNIWTVFYQSELEFSDLDQKWAKTRPLLLQILELPISIA